MIEHDIIVEPDGRLSTIYDDEIVLAIFEGDADLRTRRASHVEPCLGGRGWIADLSPVGGEPLGPFPTRQAALDAEIAWLRQEMARRRVEVR